MKTTTIALNWVKRVFPEFEFTWLGEEMRENLPKELDFIHEARNTERVRRNFANVQRTSLHIPEVVHSYKADTYYGVYRRRSSMWIPNHYAYRR